jgi:hypothetical protein
MGRNRLTYRLRSRMGLMALVAVVAGASSWWIRSSRRQEQAIDVIAANGGYMWLDRADWSIDVEFGVPQHERCGQIVLLSGGQGNSTIFDDNNLSVLNDLWRLRRVRLANTRVSSQAIEQFRASHRSVEVSN